MSWKDVAGKLITGGATLLGNALLPGAGGAAGGAIGGMIADALGVDAEPAAVLAAIEADPNAITRLRELQATHRHELQRIALEGEIGNRAEINATMRVESQSEDAYVRRARPTLLYVVGLICTLLALGAVAAVHYGKGGEYAQIVEAMSLPLTTLCAVCGVYVDRRSTRDKLVAAGQTPPSGLLAQIVNRGR